LWILSSAQTQRTRGTTFNAFRLSAAQVAMNQLIAIGKQGVEGAIRFPSIVVLPEKGLFQFLIRFFPFGFQTHHLFTLPANHRLVMFMIQMTEFYTDGGGVPLHLAGVRQRAGDLTNQAAGAFGSIYFYAHFDTFSST
jgi:hypothetical protein